MSNSAPTTKKVLIKSGFTLIELLVVISIIGILAAVVLTVISPSKLRSKARDSKRINHLKSIQAAVEFYYLTNKEYPKSSSGSASWIVVNGVSDTLSQALVGTYIQSMPRDPLYDLAGTQITDPCSTPTNYRFNYISDGSYYMLTAQVEVDSSVGNFSCEDLSRWSNGSCNALCMGFESTVQ